MSTRGRVAKEDLAIVLSTNVKGSRQASDMRRVISHLLCMGQPTVWLVLQFVQFGKFWALLAACNKNLTEAPWRDGFRWHAAVVVGVYLDKECLFGAQEVEKDGFLNCSVEVRPSAPRVNMT